MSEIVQTETTILNDPSLTVQRAQFRIQLFGVDTRCIVIDETLLTFLVKNKIKQGSTLRIFGKHIWETASLSLCSPMVTHWGAKKDVSLESTISLAEKEYRPFMSRAWSWVLPPPNAAQDHGQTAVPRSNPVAVATTVVLVAAQDILPTYRFHRAQLLS